MLESIIFDMDGLLVDSEALQFKAYRAAFRQFDIELDLEGWVEWHTTEASAARWVHSRSLDIDAEQVRSAKKVIYDQFIEERLQIKPGAKSLVTSLAGHYRLAVASGSRRESILACLDKFSLGSYFDVLVSSTEVARSKPYPDVYFDTLSRLGTNAHNTIALEDSPAGLLAATAAGVRCIVCPDSFMPRHENAFDGAALVVDSLEEVDPSVLERALRY